MQNRSTFFILTIQAEYKTAKIVSNREGEEEWEVSSSLSMEVFEENMDFETETVQKR